MFLNLYASQHSSVLWETFTGSYRIITATLICRHEFDLFKETLKCLFFKVPPAKKGWETLHQTVWFYLMVFNRTFLFMEKYEKNEHHTHIHKQHFNLNFSHRWIFDFIFLTLFVLSTKCLLYFKSVFYLCPNSAAATSFSMFSRTEKAHSDEFRYCFYIPLKDFCKNERESN